jgi:hypothetical protein
MRAFPWVVLWTLLGSPVETWAHGGFPLPTGALLDGQGADPLVTTTFGLLVPTGNGTYHWACEEAVGGNLTNAVLWTRSPRGTVLVGGRVGVWRFSENRCGLARPSGVTETDRVRAVAAHPTEPFFAVGVGMGDVRVSLDDGLTFSPTGLVIASALPGSMLLDGESGAYRLLVLWRFLLDGHAELELSSAGQPGTRVVIADPRAAAWELVAWDSLAPGHVYVRENGDTVDRILRVNTADGSAAVLREAEDDLFVAVTHDGQRVAHGGLRSVLQVSVNGGAQFEDRTTLRQVRGLRWGATSTLYAAADNWNDGFAAGVSADEGRTWSGLGRFVDIQGVQSCRPDAVNDVLTQCAQYWPALMMLFGIRPDGGVPPPVDAGQAGPPPPSGPGCASCATAAAGLDVMVLVLLAPWLRRASRAAVRS